MYNFQKKDFANTIQPQIHQLGYSATLAINEQSKALEAQGKTIHKFGLGQSPFPVPKHVQEALQHNAHQKDYLAVTGLLELRKAIAHYYLRTEQLEYSVENILIGPGTKELMFLLQLVFAGQLLIPAPSWVSYAPQAQILGKKATWLPTEWADGLRLRPEVLEEACLQSSHETHLLILNYPGNPTGMSYSPTQLQEIAQIAKKYHVLILSDEIYSGCHYTNEHLSIARFYPEGTVISNGLSKWCGAGGWRIGAFVFPHNLALLLQAMANVASETFTSVSAPIQYAAVVGYSAHPQMESYLQKTQFFLRCLSAYVCTELKKAGAELAFPQGGFYVFPNFSLYRSQFAQRGIHTSTQMCKQLLEDTGVAILPGVAFGRPETEMSCRIAFVDFDGKRILEEMTHEHETIDHNFLEKYCPSVLEGIAKLCQWVQQ